MRNDRARHYDHLHVPKLIPGAMTPNVVMRGRIATTLTGATLALVIPLAVPASAAPGEDGVSLAPLCSVLSADTLAQLRDSGLVPADQLAKLPDWAQNDDLLNTVAREGLDCSGDPVTGAEANTVLCDEVLTEAYIEGVVTDPQLDVSAAVQADILDNVTPDNVGQARDLFGCQPAPAVDEDDEAPAVDETVPDTDEGVDTGGW